MSGEKDSGGLHPLQMAADVVIPSGFMVVICSVGQTTTLRWSVGADDERDAQLVVASLQAQIASYPDLRRADLGYGQFIDYLTQGF